MNLNFLLRRAYSLPASDQPWKFTKISALMYELRTDQQKHFAIRVGQ